MTTRKIIFISKGEHSASTRYRALNYFPYLRDAGWVPEHFAAAQNPFHRLALLRTAASADVVVVLRKTFSLPYLRMLRVAAKRLIFDFDDAIFVRSDGRASRMRNSRFLRMLRVCDQVWAGNSYLAGAAKYHNDTVTILPTSIQPERYNITVSKPTDSVDLVWIGSRSTRKYLVDVLPVLESLAPRVPGLRLKIVADFNVDSTALNVRPVAWSNDREAYELASSHIGLAPMPEDPWTQGKCGLKVLQYMAAGLPTVASPAGVHRDLIEHEVSGFLADSANEWCDSLLRLINDPALRQRMGAAGKKRCAEQFSIAATFAEMQSVLQALSS
ncbi:MAG: glycosyltransferase family 4 protein [Acidiferrobacterales bacterium]